MSCVVGQTEAGIRIEVEGEVALVRGDGCVVGQSCSLISIAVASPIPLYDFMYFEGILTFQVDIAPNFKDMAAMFVE